MSADDPMFNVEAALRAELLLAAFAAADESALTLVQEPLDPEVILALLTYTTVAIKYLSDATPGSDYRATRTRLRRVVVEVLTTALGTPPPATGETHA